MPGFFVKKSLLAGVLLVTPLLWSQNLVKNPSFEEFRECPERLGTFNTDVRDWSAPTQGSTDYFNSCSTAMGTPENFNGSQPVAFGEGYVGLYLYAPNDYREYIQGALESTLVAGATYEISFYVSLAERSDYAVREFGLVFSEIPVERGIKKELSRGQLYRDRDNKYTFVDITDSHFYTDAKEWVKLRATFTASGHENYFTIGNIEDNAGTRTYKTERNAKKGAYYYLDMVSVTREVGTELQTAGERSESPESYSLDTQHIFENVLFGFDQYELDEAGKMELGELFGFLDSHKELRITINGHTDNVGSAAYNKLLSNQRCKAVSDYLVALGLSPDRIVYFPHGLEQPIADNSTEEGRQRNRRVAFSLTENN
jgi:outer membrane protein OmpA-like peptidoglycan-associated protein